MSEKRTGGPYGIPHMFKFLGETWRVEWRKKATADFDPEQDDAQLFVSERRILMARRILHWRDPQTKKLDPAYAWEAFLHEVTHIVDELWPKMRGKTDRYGRKRSRWFISHKAIHRLDEALGVLVIEAGIRFPCCCRKCQ